jgi:hypothetical protein
MTWAISISPTTRGRSVDRPSEHSKSHLGVYHISNLYNWDYTKNVLYLDLLDNPVSGGTVLVTTPPERR